jgi:hypothetical protein
MRINKTVDDFDLEPYRNRDDWETIQLLDGTVYEKISWISPEGEYQEYIHKTYDNNYDETLPLLLSGVKNPSAEDRVKSRKKKKYFLPKKLSKLRVRPLTFWVQGESNLTEILSVYSQVSAKVNIGKVKAYKLLAFLVYLNKVEGKTIFQLPLGAELYEIFERRAKSHAFEGYWGNLNKLLQMQSSLLACQGHIKFDYSDREIDGNLIRTGKDYYENLTISLTACPVNTPARKRGYNDKGSRKDPSKTKEVVDNFSSSETTRESSFLSPKQALYHFLLGPTNPATKEYKPQSVVDYQKRMNRLARQQRRKELERIRSLNGEIKTWVDEAILARNKEKSKDNTKKS